MGPTKTHRNNHQSPDQRLPSVSLSPTIASQQKAKRQNKQQETRDKNQTTTKTRIIRKWWREKEERN